ncbi:MAG: PstS family phosphate ABC transporter substrate-binding protein [Microthrixaceae bacterium]
MKFKSLVAGALASATLITGVGTAGALAPEPSGYDDLPDQILAGGSDTTYRINQEFDVVYNQAKGCETINSYPTSPVGNTRKCVGFDGSVANGQTDTKGNWDHDISVQAFPTGSSTGVKQLLAGELDAARSSRGPSTGEGAANFWGIGKDGLSVVTYGTRTPGNLTLAQLQGIYNCSITTWDTITGNPADAGQTIEPIGMNASSGTKSTFQSFLGFDPNAGACVKKVDLDGAGPAAPVFPFENDSKPVEASTTTISNINNAVWWMSWASFRGFPYLRGSAQQWNVNSVAPSSASISNNTYPFTRFIFQVTKKVDATPSAAGSDDVFGATVAGSPAVYTPDSSVATGGKPGAVREFTEFLCKNSANHTVNDYSGLTNFQELGNRYTLTGFIRVPNAERTNGVCKVVPGT